MTSNAPLQQAESMTPEQALQRAVAYHQAGQLQEAERLYRAILQAQPRQPDANHNLGVLAVQTKQAAAGLPHFKAALEANPEQGQYWLSYIDALLQAGHEDAARQVLAQGRQRGLQGEAVEVLANRLVHLEKVAPDQPAELECAIEHREAGRYREAALIVQNWLISNPQDASAYALLAQILSLDNQNEPAWVAINAALSINPDLPIIQRNHARLLLRQQKLDEALQAAQAAYQSDATDPETQLVLAAVLRANNQNEQAYRLVESALQSRPNYAEAFANRALLKLHGKDLVGALADAEKSLFIKPHLEQLWVIVSSLRYQLKNLPGAIDALRKALSHEPDNVGHLVSLGELTRQAGMVEDAIVLLEKATSIAPDNADAWVNLGTALQESQRIPEAKAAYAKALEIAPEQAEVANNLGALAKEEENWEEALRYFDQALTYRPTQVAILTNRGAALNTLERYDEAETCYRRALELKPDYAEAHSNLGLTLQNLGRLDEAEACYRGALDIISGSDSNISQHASYNYGLCLATRGLQRESVSYLQQAFSERVGWQHAADNELSSGLVTAFIELTNKCNFHCDFCPSDSQQRNQGFMSLELIRQLYDEFAEKDLVEQVDLHLMGEPTLHPNLVEVLDYAASKDIKTELVTNGSTLNTKTVPRILDALYGTLVVSLQTPTKETFKHRGEIKFSWSRYIENIRLLVREHLKRVALKHTCRNTLELRVMITKDSKLAANIIESLDDIHGVMHEWYDFVTDVEIEFGLSPFNRKELASELFATLATKKTIKYPLQRGLTLVFWQGFAFANSMLSSEYSLEFEESASFCPRPFTDVAVLSNGDVTLCCLDYDGKLAVGNMKDGTIETILNGKPTMDLRAAMFGRQPLPLFCQQCQARAVPRKVDGPTKLV